MIYGVSVCLFVSLFASSHAIDIKLMNEALFNGKKGLTKSFHLESEYLISY